MTKILKHTCHYLSQDLTEGTFWQQKSIVRYLQRKKDLAFVNYYRKFEEIIFTNNKYMSVLTRIEDAFYTTSPNVVNDVLTSTPLCQHMTLEQRH